MLSAMTLISDADRRRARSSLLWHSSGYPDLEWPKVTPSRTELEVPQRGFLGQVGDLHELTCGQGACWDLSDSPQDDPWDSGEFGALQLQLCELPESLCDRSVAFAMGLSLLRFDLGLLACAPSAEDSPNSLLYGSG